jgi:predicted nucleotide-binding protein
MMNSVRDKVFIVNGRDRAAYEAIRQVLLALGVEPITWRQATEATEENNPTFGDILEKGFELSSAVLVLLTPDEHTVLRAELRKATDAGDRNKTGPVGQPRPNVLYELGYAMRASRNKTLVVLFGGCRVPSDMYGLHTIEHNPLQVEHTVAEIEVALRRAGVRLDHVPRASLLERCDLLRSLGSNEAPLGAYIRAGTAVRTSEFAFSRVLDGRCDEILMTGTNFGDQFGKRGKPIDGLFGLLKQQLLSRSTTRVTLVFAPPRLLRENSERGFKHLRDFSLPRLCDLYDDADLDEQCRGRLRILAHPGAMFFQAFVRDPLDEERGLLVATPRWPSDTAGQGRFFFAVRRGEHPGLFDALYAQIPSDLELGDAVPFDEVARELGIERLSRHTSR